MTCYGVGNASLFPRYERVTSNNGVGSGIRVPYYPLSTILHFALCTMGFALCTLDRSGGAAAGCTMGFALWALHFGPFGRAGPYRRVSDSRASDSRASDSSETPV